VAVLPILKVGNAMLRKKAEEVHPQEIASKEFVQLLQDMVDTMRANDGAGLAAPQIGVGKQIFLVEICQNPRYPEAAEIPLSYFINPRIKRLTDELEEDWEGCLSVPGYRGVVARPGRVSCDALDQNGEEFQIEAEGFFFEGYSA